MSSSKNSDPNVSVRIVSADYYMTSPTPGLDIGYSTYRGIEIKKVPVIRIFGSISTGLKVCLHVHGVFPYLYIPYDGSAPPDQMGHQIALALDKAINILQGQGTSSFHHVFKMKLISGVPIYGYHAKEHQLFKVYFYNPITRKHSYDLLLNGAVLKKILQPCEAHIPFILQFLMDFNLQGMNFVHLRKALARRKPDYIESFESSNVEPVSTCELELDCFAGDILNSLDVQGGVQMNPGLAALWEEEIERRKLKNINVENIRPPPSQARLKAIPSSSHSFYKDKLKRRLVECATELGDVSLSFVEVNEQMETSLAIETPEEGRLLSASSLDFHKIEEKQTTAPSISEGEAELLDILCDLADEHSSVSTTLSANSNLSENDKILESQSSKTSRITVTSPLLEILSTSNSVEDLPFDDDSILGTQHSKTSVDRVVQASSTDDFCSDSDEDRETLEMSQVFDESEDGYNNTLSYRKNRNAESIFSKSSSLMHIAEESDENEEGGSSTSSTSFSLDTHLPNVDGADDSSEDEQHASITKTAKKARKYKPLFFRRPSRESVVKETYEVGTTLKLMSPSNSYVDSDTVSFAAGKGKLPNVKDLLTETHSEFPCGSQISRASNSRLGMVPCTSEKEYADALYTMSYLSPTRGMEAPESPPQPGTPTEDMQLKLPLLQNVSSSGKRSGSEVKLNAGWVVLKSIKEEVAKYEMETRSKLRIRPVASSSESFIVKNAPRKRCYETVTNASEKQSQISDESILENSSQRRRRVRETDVLKCAEASWDRKEFDKESKMSNVLSKTEAISGALEASLNESKKSPFRDLIDEDTCERFDQFKDVSPFRDLVKDSPVITEREFVVFPSQENQEDCATKRILEVDVKKNQIGIEQGSQENVHCKIFHTKNSFSSVTKEKVDECPSSKAGEEHYQEVEATEREDSITCSSCQTELSTTSNNNSIMRDSTSVCLSNSSCVEIQQLHVHESSGIHCTQFNTSNSFWNDETLLDSNVIVDKTYITPRLSQTNRQTIAIQPQIFHPSTVYTTTNDGPSVEHVLSTFDIYNIPPTDNGTPFWGDAKDVPSKASAKDFLRSTLLIRSKLICHLPEFKADQEQICEEKAGETAVPVIITPLASPPSKQCVMKWLENKKNLSSASLMESNDELKNLAKVKKQKDDGDRSQLEAPSLNNSFGFRVSFGNCLEAKAVHQNQYLTIMSLELHYETRQNLKPDPEFDPVIALFYTITNDVPLDSSIPAMVTGAIVVDDEEGRKSNLFRSTGVVNIDALPVTSEVALYREFVKLVNYWNPDILVGYEIELLSWGFILQRGAVLGIPIHNLLSRIPETNSNINVAFPEDIIEGGYVVEKNSDIAVTGRIVLNLWRILRAEIALQSYTFENMAFHVLHRRVATFTFEKLTSWWKSNHDRWLVIEHYITRARGNVELLEQLDVIGRTSELARLFGIQFYEVFTRGSQYRVESMMLRLAKPKNFVAASPSVMQRSKMKAPEWLPLILEPESKFYTDPVLVLDFQSLYPSMIIAYNYCYSTCLGKINLLGKNEPFEFGCTQLLVPPSVVKRLVKNDLVNISPAGVAFVKPEVRRGIIPQMLSEILDTRIMVKQSMKEYEGDTTLRRVFDSRQLGLKLIANVTYGYTSANFSGRMPCIEIGDSVVSKGRETLEQAIRLIEENVEWKARVIYGDTDSVFVLLPGRSRQDAFAIGYQIADAVTQTNPQPVKLKFEKVYQPCILQTKKRYVGYKYESLNQKEPVYEAKGIETVRRDGCPAVVKILERSLRLLFESHDVSKVKSYVERQFSKILQNRNSLQDFIFAKEFRGRQGYKPGACVPALEIAKQKVRIDRRSEPRIGERVPYIVVYGSPGVPLIRLVVPAEQLLVDTSLRLNGHYYISRAIIPALQRCLGLLGIDVLSWYQGLPRVAAAPPSVAQPNEHGVIRKATISQYFGSATCLLCDEPIVTNGLCATCGSNQQASAFSLAAMERLREKDYFELVSLCRSCTGNSRIEQDCISMDCPVLYRRVRALQNMQLLTKWRDALSVL